MKNITAKIIKEKVGAENRLQKNMLMLMKFGWVILGKARGWQALHGLIRWMSLFVLGRLMVYEKPLINKAIRFVLHHVKKLVFGVL